MMKKVKGCCRSKTMWWSLLLVILGAIAVWDQFFNKVESKKGLLDDIFGGAATETKVLTEAQIKLLEDLIDILNSKITGKDFQGKFKSLMESGRLSEYGVTMTEEQQKKFDKLVETRKLQDLKKLYLDSNIQKRKGK